MIKEYWLKIEDFQQYMPCNELLLFEEILA